TRTHQADIVSHLVEGHSNHAHCAGEFNKRVAVSLRLKVVLSLGEFVDSSELLELLGNLSAEVSRGVQASTSSGAADSQFAQARQGGFDALDAKLEPTCIAGEFLAEGNWDSIHQVGTAGLNNVLPLVSLLQQRFVKHLKTWNQVIDGSFGRSNVGCGREGVIGRLTHVHVVVRVQLNTVLLSEGSDDLVGVHVGRSTGTGLEDIDRELIVVLTGGNFLACRDDGVGDFRVERSGVLVDLST